MGRLDGKVALISGGARGQGAEEGRRFAAEGAKVVLGDVLDDEGKAVAAEIGANAAYVHLDVTSQDSWREAVAATEKEFGSLNVLINNAGIVRFTPVNDSKATADDYRDVINVNQVGVFFGMGAVVEPMTRAGGGSIINISSIDGLVGMPGVAAYVSSKFAVRGMTKVAALELADRKIRANSIHPGYIDTPMVRGSGIGDFEASPLAKSVPWHRLGTVTEIAHLAVFLASDESSYCTGSEFVIDGGVTAGINPMGMA